MVKKYYHAFYLGLWLTPLAILLLLPSGKSTFTSVLSALCISLFPILMFFQTKETNNQRKKLSDFGYSFVDRTFGKFVLRCYKVHDWLISKTPSFIAKIPDYHPTIKLCRTYPRISQFISTCSYTVMFAIIFIAIWDGYFIDLNILNGRQEYSLFVGVNLIFLLCLMVIVCGLSTSTKETFIESTTVCFTIPLLLFASTLLAVIRPEIKLIEMFVSPNSYIVVIFIVLTMYFKSKLLKSGTPSKWALWTYRGSLIGLLFYLIIQLPFEALLKGELSNLFNVKSLIYIALVFGVANFIAEVNNENNSKKIIFGNVVSTLGALIVLFGLYAQLITLDAKGQGVVKPLWEHPASHTQDKKGIYFDYKEMSFVSYDIKRPVATTSTVSSLYASAFYGNPLFLNVFLNQVSMLETKHLDDFYNIALDIINRVYDGDYKHVNNKASNIVVLERELLTNIISVDYIC